MDSSSAPEPSRLVSGASWVSLGPAWTFIPSDVGLLLQGETGFHTLFPLVWFCSSCSYLQGLFPCAFQSTGSVLPEILPLGVFPLVARADHFKSLL